MKIGLIIIGLCILILLVGYGCDMTREEVNECKKCCEFYGNATWIGDMQSCVCQPDFSENIFWCVV